MEVKSYHPKDINPAKYNPRHITDEELAGLRESLKKFGFVQPLIVNTRTGTLVGGHQRLKASILEGYESVPVMEVDLSLAEEKALNVALNSPHIQGKFDEVILKDLLIEIKTDLPEMFEQLNFNEFVFHTIETLPPKGPSDYTPEPPKQPKTKKGDLWILGEHRLFCGDATLIDDIDKLMGTQKADLGFCDPPYNLGFKYNSYEDNLSQDDYETFSKTWFSNLKTVTQRQITTMGTKNIKLMANLDDEVAGVACWVKKNWITGCHIAKLQQWEPIFFFGDYTKLKRTSDLYEINRVEQKDVGKNHTCPKQIELINELLTNYCIESVVDLFGGSGTTLISAELNKKKAFLMEMDTQYCDVIIKRWQALTEKDAILESTGETYEQVSRY